VSSSGVHHKYNSESIHCETCSTECRRAGIEVNLRYKGIVMMGTAQRVEHMLRVVVIAVVVTFCGWSWIRSGACMPWQLHCGSDGKPRCPVLVFPVGISTASLVSHHTDGVKHVSFATHQSPDDIRAFFAQSLPRVGWEHDPPSTENERYTYLNGAGTAQHPQGSHVKITQRISGPFVPTMCDGT
jgi:hypothetical protein